MKLCCTRWLYFLASGLCYIGFGEMISILNAKWAYDVSAKSAVGTSVKGCVNRKKRLIACYF